MQFSLSHLLRLQKQSNWGNPTLLGLELFALFSVFIAGAGRNVWLSVITLICLCSLGAWLGNTRRQRLMLDIPISTIASAAQGYVKLDGHIAEADGAPLLAKLSDTPCAWYRYLIEERNSDDEWRTKEFGDSTQSLILDDGTGRCSVDPAGAEITSVHKSEWTEYDVRYTEYLLLPDDAVYALGDFSTRGPDTSDRAFKQELSELLTYWKSDRKWLLQHYDVNQDGEIDVQEWERVRANAAAEVRRRLAQRAAEPALHHLSQTADGRPFLISNYEQHRLKLHYRLWAWAHLSIFFAGCTGLSYWMAR